MKMERKDILVLSFSHSGNNDALARRVAEELGARHEAILPRHRSMFSLVSSSLLGMRPRVAPAPEVASGWGFLLLCAPLWMGKPASPLCRYLDYLKKNPVPYGFLSISGGGRENTKVEADLSARAGRAPEICIDLAITDLLPQETAADMKAMMGYRLTEGDLSSLSVKVRDMLLPVV